jgi:hypothetical protein
MATGKTNNPEGINQYTGKPKSTFEAAKTRVGGAFASAKERTKENWEAVDKTVKYAAAGAAIGAASGVIGNATTRIFLDKVKNTSNAAKLYGAAGAIAGGTSGASIGSTPKGKAIGAASLGIPTAAMGAGIGALVFKSAQMVAKMNPALKIGINTVGGAVTGGYLGYKIDREEEAVRKATGHQRQFKQT